MSPPPIPYLDDDAAMQTNYPPAPIPYLEVEDDEDGDSGSANIASRAEPTVLGEPETRIQVSPKLSQPYKWICRIIVRSETATYAATGFLINIPWANTGCILTAGHNLWMKNDRAYARSVVVMFPGKLPITINNDDTAQSPRIIANPEYLRRYIRDYDYGIILVPGLQGQGFGYSAIMGDIEIPHATASVFGYAGDKAPGTMWGSGSRLSRTSTQSVLHYDIGTYRDQSGSPVYVWRNGYWAAIGIHLHGFYQSISFNHAIRLTVDVLQTVLEWVMHPLQKVELQAWDEREKMVKISAGAGSFYTSAGTGLVVSRFSPDDFTKVAFLPLESVPGPVELPEDQVRCGIASCAYPSNYLHMNADQLFQGQREQAGGGGSVKCQPEVRETNQMFRIKQDPNTPGAMNIESVQYPGVHLRMDSAVVNSTTPDGRDGSVNAQWAVSDLERFQDIRAQHGAAMHIEPSEDFIADIRRAIQDLQRQLGEKDDKIRDLERQLGEKIQELEGQRKIWNDNLTELSTRLDQAARDRDLFQKRFEELQQSINRPSPPPPPIYSVTPTPPPAPQKKYAGFRWIPTNQRSMVEVGSKTWWPPMNAYLYIPSEGEYYGGPWGCVMLLSPDGISGSPVYNGWQDSNGRSIG